ncbi:putative zinc-binding peptidase [Catalinimonas sp. 4WD22]|uniref:zinc-binding metallopeptidase family protein n=1 Tax=Catalinimonas locisalis TaxID=3133978 RepID=UPI0031011C18
MKLFTCKQCGQLLYFENTHCESCGSTLGFLAEDMELHTLPAKPGSIFSLPGKSGQYRYCENMQHQACNWLVPANQDDPFCEACSLNHTIPNLQEANHKQLWQKMELAKHRLIYTLLCLNLPLVSKAQQSETGLAFDFKADRREAVLTGHDQGLITLNIAEADDAERAKRREEMGEPYRTLLGHFRHEVGHYYWDRLIANTHFLSDFRRMFGDERQNYGDALKRHYQQGPPANWKENYISEYATAHPWEDWAETWAHYLHLLDTLETAHAFGLQVSPQAAEQDDSMDANMNINPYTLTNFDDIINLWLPLTFAMNSINRSMGQADMYPFVIPPPVIEKLRFVHQVCQGKH